MNTLSQNWDTIIFYYWSLETRDQEENFFHISKKNDVLDLSKSAL